MNCNMEIEVKIFSSMNFNLSFCPIIFSTSISKWMLRILKLMMRFKCGPTMVKGISLGP
jgi:hypothetical protein